MRRSNSISGSTDMGNVSKILPSIHPMIGIAPPRVALHTEEFAQWAASEIGQRGVLDGAKALAMTGIDVFMHAGRCSRRCAPRSQTQSASPV